MLEKLNHSVHRNKRINNAYNAKNSPKTNDQYMKLKFPEVMYDSGFS